MDKKKVGNAIAYLRKRAGYTQKDLADRIGISDKAVSKWERGLGLPDIAYVGKLSILLDTDTESLLAGDVIHHDKEWRGLLIMSDNSYGISAGTIIYDKPLVYFLISYFLLVGIKHIYVICNFLDQEFMESEFGDGSELGIKLFYCGQRKAGLRRRMEEDKTFRNAMVVYRRNFIYGVDQTRFFQRAMMNRDRITILSLPKKMELHISERDSVSGFRDMEKLSFDDSRRLVASDSDEKIHTQYDYCEIPVLFCPKNKLEFLYETTEDGTLKINPQKCTDEHIYTEVLDRGFVDMQIDTMDQVLDTSGFIRLLQNACGMEIYCLEEIAWRRGMISFEKLKEFGSRKQGSNYGKYVLSLAKRYEESPMSDMNETGC